MTATNRKIAYLFNPVSGSGAKSAVRKLIETITAERDIPFESLLTNPEGQYPDLEKNIQAGRITDLVVVGGDGTISQVSGALKHTGVRFGIIPMGSGNGLAFAAGIPKDPVKALEIIFNGNSSAVDGFFINDHFSCMLSGIGFDAKVADEFARSSERGLWTYIKVSARNFFAARTYPFCITCPGYDINTEAFFVSIANSNQFGNQFTIAPKARLNDGLIDVVIVQKMNKVQVLLAVLHQLRFGDVQEKIFRRRSIIYFQASELTVRNPSMAPLHIDGDPAATAERFFIKVVPSAFQLIQP